MISIMVKVLSELLGHDLCQDSTCVLKKSFTSIDIMHSLNANSAKRKHLPSLSVLVANGIMKAPTAENIAISGLNYSHLKVIYQRKGEDGLYNVFTMKNSQGLPRVTKTKRILEEVIPKLAEFFSKCK